jgi:hypothetical protein
MQGRTCKEGYEMMEARKEIKDGWKDGRKVV